MKILEVKNNLVKISYTAKDNLVISGFVIIEDSQYPYVAQVMSLKADSGVNYAIVKLLFTFNQEGVVKNYNGTVPELDAIITPLASNELLDILPIEKPLTIGKLAQQKFVLNVDYSILEKNLLVCSDNTENTDILLSNFAKQITENNNKSIIFDTDGTINAENRLVFGEEFKLPLNYESINFIYENDLNDVEPASKAFIQDIFLEVQEYSKTVLDKFIPFDTFISVVDAQYKELNIPELVLLKNRLLKYKENNVFAQSAKDFQSLRASVRANLSTLIDISSADPSLQKLIMNYVYDEIEELDLYVYGFAKIDSENADKKLIRRFLSEDKIYTTIACPHNYKYLYELKERANNLILFTPQTMQHDFASYNIFLNKLNPDECVIYGKSTQNIPLIIEMMPLEDIDAAIKAEETPIDVQPASNSADDNKPVKDDFSDDSNSYSQEAMLHDDLPAAETQVEVENSTQTEIKDDTKVEEEEQVKEDIIEQPADSIVETVDIPQTAESETVEEDVIVKSEDEDQLSEEPLEQVAVDETPVQETQNVEADMQLDTLETLQEPLLPQEETNNTPEISDVQPDDVSELKLEELKLEDSLSEFIDLPPQIDEESLQTYNEPVEEELSDFDTALSSSVDSHLQTDFIEDDSTDNEELEELPQVAESAPTPAEPSDTLTLDDLDYITDVNQPKAEDTVQDFGLTELPLPPLPDEEPATSAAQESLTDYESLLAEETPIAEEKPPVVPVYPAETTPVNPQKDFFEPGDRVNHPKYGEGVVEKMIKYGNKVLCSINFANGRRLLDPTISQLQKL